VNAGALSYAEALATIIGHAAPLPDEVVGLAQAHGRALAGVVSSGIDVPPWDNAGMDGYAVRRGDVLGASATHPLALPVTHTIAAGAGVGGLRVNAGECMRIMTGAPMPAGADCVVRVEDTDGGADIVLIHSDRDAVGRGNVRPRGEDVRSGELVFGAGTTITATHLGVIAGIGQASVRVHRRPRVALVSSGDELVLVDDAEAVRSGAKIVASTSYALPALLQQAGAEMRVLPIARDTLADMTRALREALDGGCDLLLTTGGVSVGEHDFTRAALVEAGGSMDFWRARIRPGGPIGTGTVGGVPWLGLPGNPVSSMVTGFLFAWPVVRRLGGHARCHHQPVRVRMLERAEVAAPLTHFLRVRLQRGSDGMLEARLAGAQGSNLFRTLAAADALLVVPDHVDAVQPGMLLDAIVLPEFALSVDDFASPVEPSSAS
jgi:molybdopterin molybdotransferase